MKLYSNPSAVGVPYQEVAILNSTGESNWTDEKQMMQSMRNKASDLGANGVILNNINEASAGAKVAAQVLGTFTQRKGTSVAIYVPSDTARVAAACGVRSGPVQAVTTPTAPQVSLPKDKESAPSPQTKSASTTMQAAEHQANGTWAQASIGAARSTADKDAAVFAFEDGQNALARHEWEKAEQYYQKAILLNGAEAKYHAAMGALMMTLHRWADAEASYTAAMLIDVDNAEYRKQVKEARSRRY